MEYKILTEDDFRTPRLRDGHRIPYGEKYLLNEIPERIIKKIGAYMVYLIYIGRKDISGADWGDAFADAIGGIHYDSPIGIADIGFNGMGYSMKTVKNANPFTCEKVRLISGRCSPDFSYGIADPHENIQNTGRAVLEIWNERVNIAREEHNPLRTSVLIRSNDLLSYTLFEEDTDRYRVSDYIWEENEHGNLIGIHKETRETCFTWQPHGSQFTIHTKVPEDAIKFSIRKPPVMTKDDVLDSLSFDDSWVKIIKDE